MTSNIKQRTITLLAVTTLTTSALGGIAINHENASTATASTKQIKIDENTAVKKFKQKFKDSKVNEIQLESNRGQYQYEVSGFDGNKEYTADVNAKTGKVTKTETERLDQDEQKSNDLDLSQLISRKQATKIAEKQVKGSHAKEWVLENEDGTPTWKVTVHKDGQSTDVKINAQNKQVLQAEKDN